MIIFFSSRYDSHVTGFISDPCGYCSVGGPGAAVVRKRGPDRERGPQSVSSIVLALGVFQRCRFSNDDYLRLVLVDGVVLEDRLLDPINNSGKARLEVLDYKLERGSHLVINFTRLLSLVTAH